MGPAAEGEWPASNGEGSSEEEEEEYEELCPDSTSGSHLVCTTAVLTVLTTLIKGPGLLIYTVQ